MLDAMLKKIIMREDLSYSEAVDSMNAIMKGEATTSQVGAFLAALRMKGETVNEITGCAVAMRNSALKVEIEDYAIDTCGTGGDGGRTFNISTASAIIASCAGIKVAKYGNRAISSKSGSADVLNALGIKIQMTPEVFVESVNKANFGFLFAPYYHTSMKNVALVRRELGIRTVFNILGPVTNPAGVKGQVLGVFDKGLVSMLAEVLRNLGTKRAMVVHGLDGLDEVTTTTKTLVSEIKDGEITSYEIDPADFNIPYARLEDIKGGDAEYNAKIITDIFKGKKGFERDIVLLNAACALYVGNKVESINEGLVMAEYLVNSGAAMAKLEELREVV
ncbi:MAG TPA: anthranilate phosphoribosyltransferase [Clostridia bacterium]|nr:anthranilate phosphoribosyltransferase [Clostridia bacterium]